MKPASTDPSENPEGHADSRSGNELFVASVEKAFRVLELYAASGVELGLSEVSQKTGLGKSATQRFLFTLAALGYLIQDEHTKAFRLSAKILGLSSASLSVDTLKNKAREVLEAANAECEETINLTVLEGTDVVYVLRFPSRHVVSVDISPGYKLPAFCTAPGRVFLAFMGKEKRDKLLSASALRKRTELTVTDRRQLDRIVARVGREGYCIADQESFIGDISTAAPIFDERGEVVAAVNIAVPYPRWSVEGVRAKLTPIVVDCARRITDKLSERG